MRPDAAGTGAAGPGIAARAILEQARSVTIPVHVLLQWDDEHNDRQAALELFDAFGSSEKTLQANLGGTRASRRSPGRMRHGSSPDI